MVGNGWANVIAALIIAGAIVWAVGFNRHPAAPTAIGATIDEERLAEFYARAVGDIRNDIVVNCGCCGEGAQRADF